MKRYFLLWISLINLIVYGQTSNLNITSAIVSSYSKQEIFENISFGNYDLISANLKFSDKNNVQKINISPFKLFDNTSKFKDSKLNFTLKNGISTFGLAYGYDNSNPFNGNSRVKRIFMNTPSVPSKKAKEPDQSDAEYEEYIEQYTNKIDAVRINYLKELSKNSFSFNIGYNISLFEIIAGDKIINSDNLIANKYTVKGHSISGDFNYGFDENIGINGGVVYQKKRNSAVEKQEMINYYGFNFAIAWRAIYLKKEDLLRKDKNYLKSFFIPSIIIGCSYEYLKANGEEIYYENGIAKQSILTPFIDIKISPVSQFRIGIPVKKYQTTENTLQPIGPYIQYSLSITNLE